MEKYIGQIWTEGDVEFEVTLGGGIPTFTLHEGRGEIKVSVKAINRQEAEVMFEQLQVELGGTSFDIIGKVH